MSESDIFHSTDFQPSLIGHFIFDDELYFAQDDALETADGYLIATDVLVQRMLQEVQEKHSPEEIKTLDNINFYPIFNLATHSIRLEGTYWYANSREEMHGAFVLSLSQDEQSDLILAFEKYCIEKNNCSCLDMLNIIRAEDGLSPLHSKESLNAQIQYASNKACEHCKNTTEDKAMLLTRIKSELTDLTQRLLQQSPEVILSHMFEYAIKTDIVSIMEETHFNEAQMKALLTLKTPLDDLYAGYGNCSSNAMDVLVSYIEDKANELATGEQIHCNTYNFSENFGMPER